MYIYADDPRSVMNKYSKAANGQAPRLALPVNLAPVKCPTSFEFFCTVASQHRHEWTSKLSLSLSLCIYA